MMRASTDPITNNVLMPSIDLLRHVGLLFKGHLPLSSLPAYLHETTHHWCFHTHVGTAAALLYLRARRGLLLEADGGEGARHLDPPEDYVRYRMFDTLYRPLSEGLACFGEFDLVPVQDQVGTPVLRRAIGQFYRRGRESGLAAVAKSERMMSKLKGEGLSPDEIAEMFAAVALMLTECRAGMEWIDRKVNVLARPFTLDDGGYALGYLSVKLLYTHAASQESDLRHPEPFLAYMRWLFYEDVELVDLLLSKETQDLATRVVLVNHLVKRVNEFLVMDHRSAYRRFVSWLENPAVRVPPSSLTHALGEFQDRDRTPNWMVECDQLALARREYISIGRSDIPVVVGESGTVRFVRPGAAADAPPAFAIPRGTNLPPGEYAGTVEFVMSAVDNVMALVATVDNEGAHVVVVTDADGARREVVKDLWERIRLIERVGNMHGLLAELDDDAVVQHCVAACGADAARLYRHIVMHMFEPRQRAGLEAQLVRKGLRALLTPGQIELVAACSMMPAAMMPDIQREVLKTFERTETDLKAIHQVLSPVLSVQDEPDDWRDFLRAL